MAAGLGGIDGGYCLMAGGTARSHLDFHFGLVLAGWGLFNLVEGLVNHHLLQIHHVRDDLGGPWMRDAAFIISGLLLIGGGIALHLRDSSNDPSPDSAGRTSWRVARGTPTTKSHGWTKTSPA